MKINEIVVNEKVQINESLYNAKDIQLIIETHERNEWTEISSDEYLEGLREGKNPWEWYLQDVHYSTKLHKNI